jgi:hypothetical protein
MTVRRLAILQWVGLLLGAAAFAAQLVLGFGITEARCGAGGSEWGIDHDVWQAALLGASAALVVCAEAAAIVVFRGTSSTSYEAEPAPGRIRFFAIAAMAANLIFLFIVLLAGTAAIVNVTCRQA